MRRFAVVLWISGSCAAPGDPAPLGPSAPAGRPAPGRSASSARVLGPGCVGSPYTLAQDAIDAASAGDAVEVCAGTYAEQLVVDKDLTLTAIAGPSLTTVDASGSGHALEVSGGANVVVTGFTLRGGWSPGIGGNVRCEDAELVLRDNVLEDGTASDGGGAGLVRCGGSIEGNTFRANTATSAGGGLSSGGGVSVVGNTFEDNVADRDGGGAYVADSSEELAGNTFLGNVADADGGGLYVDAGAPHVDANTFEDNEADDEGGGLRVKLSTAVVTDNVFTSNRAGSNGGGSRVSHEAVVMSGNTWVGNTASTLGGALLLFESASLVSAETYLENTADQGGAVAVVEGWGDVALEDSTFDGNTAEEGGHLYVALTGHTTALRRVDLVGGLADDGGAIHATDSDLVLANVLLEANEADDAGGALFLDGVTGALTHVVAIWNEAPHGSALQVEDGLAGLDVASSVFAENMDGEAVTVGSGTAPSLRYDSFDGNDDDFSGLEDVIGRDGNLGAPSLFTDPAGGDYTLAPGSLLLDAGDPAESDRDGTRCDIGLHGGPDA